MKLTDLLLNRWLYKVPQQDIETKDAVYDSSNVIPAPVPPLPAGSAAQDINTSNVTINGANITPGTLVLTVGDWGWGQTCVFSSVDLNTVAWTGGNFKTAGGTILTISAGDTDARLTAAGLTSPMNAKVYIYLDLNLSSTLYQCTYTPGDSVGQGKVLIAVAKNAAVAIPQTNATFNMTEATQIVGDNILANTINASKIEAGTITATQISASYIYAGYISADQINAGTITGITFQTASSGMRVVMTNAGTYAGHIQFYNSSGVYAGGLRGSTSSGSAVIGFTDVSNNLAAIFNAATGDFSLMYTSGKYYAGGMSGGFFWQNVGTARDPYIGADHTSSTLFTEWHWAPFSTGYQQNLGDSSYQWYNLYLSGTAFVGAIYMSGAIDMNGYNINDTGSIIPGSGTTNLGNTTYRWNNLYLYPATSDVSSDGQFHYYNTGGVQELQIYMAGFGYSCDLSFL